MATTAFLVAGVGTVQAYAIDEDPTNDACVSNSQGSVSVSPTSVTLGQSVTLSSSFDRPAGCPLLAPYIVFQDVSGGTQYAASAPYRPQANGRYLLKVNTVGHTYVMASTTVVAVTLPVVNGHPLGSITRGGDQEALFAQAIAVPNAVVAIRGDVELDLAGRYLRVAPGVQIIGQRDAAHPSGPRLFTSWRTQHELLSVGDRVTPSDNVRITGIRFDGGESSDPCDEADTAHSDTFGVEVYSSQNVEIDHNEFYHLNGGGVAVDDPIRDLGGQSFPLGRLNRENSGSVWVHDNYIHDNQHPQYCGVNPLDKTSGYGAGYGVIVGGGAFAKVEHNVFSDNRHAIASDGADGTGYLLTGNLLLRPGLDSYKYLSNHYGQQIDVHGQLTCPGGSLSSNWNCGPAGEYFVVGQNTVVGFNDLLGGTDTPVVELRGTPTSWNASQPTVDGMQVQGNVFAQPHGIALTQTVSGQVDAGGNSFAVDLRAFYTSGDAPCDFDGDHANDRFRASGAGWWYYSSRAGRWVALATSASTSVSFSDANGDGLCDATSAGSPRITTPWLETFPGLVTATPNLIGSTPDAVGASLTSAGLVLGSVSTAASAAPAGNITATFPASGAAAQIGSPVNIVVSSGPVTVPNLTGGIDEDRAISAIQAAGLVSGGISRFNDPSIRAGIVMTQSPTAGTLVAPGTKVTFSVSLGPEPGTDPDPGGGGADPGGNCAITCP